MYLFIIILYMYIELSSFLAGYFEVYYVDEVEYIICLFLQQF